MLNLELHWPPSLNETYGGRANGGGLYMKKLAKDWKEQSFWLIKQQLPHGHKPLEGDLVARVQLTPPNRRGDIDNRLKIMLDALELAKVFNNDRQIKRLEVDWLKPKKPGFVRVALHSLAA